MVAYDNTWLYNKHVRAEADEALYANCITIAEREAIYANYPVGFYTPNIWGRIALALLAMLSAVFSLGYLGMIFGIFRSPAVFLILSGIFFYVILEVIVVKRLKHFNAGTDNVMLLMVVAYIIGGIYACMPGETHFLILSCSAFVLCTALAARFADSVMGILAALSWFAVIFFGWLELGAFAKATAPFVLMVVSALLYFISLKADKERSLLLYRYCISSISTVSLVVLYGAGNYYVVKELANEMFHLNSGLHDAIPFGWFFWIWTLAVPLVYVGAGIWNKNTILMRTGLILIPVSILTYRHYYSILSPDKAMIIGGVILTLTSYAIIKYLTEPKHGFTMARKPENTESPDFAELLSEKLVAKDTDAHGHNTDTNSWG